MILDCYHTSLLPGKASFYITRMQVASDDPQSDVYYFIKPSCGCCVLKFMDGDTFPIMATHLVHHESTGAWELWYTLGTSKPRRNTPMRQLLGCRVEVVK